MNKGIVGNLALALEALAKQGVPDGIRPGPAFRRRLEVAKERRSERHQGFRNRRAWIAISLITLLVLGATGYAFSSTGQRLFSQVLGRWDGSTPAEQSHRLDLQQSTDGITVTLHTAYFESNRIGIDYTVAGLDMESPEDANRFTVSGVLTDRSNLQTGQFPSAGGSGISAVSGIQGDNVPLGTIRQVDGFDVTNAASSASGLNLQFQVRVDEALGEGPAFDQFKHYGPWLFDFAVPFIPDPNAVTFTTQQTVENAGVPVTLNDVIVTQATVEANIYIDPEQSLSPGIVNLFLIPPGGWNSNGPPPMAYVATQLGDTGRFRVIFHNNDHLLEAKGVWSLTIASLNQRSKALDGAPSEGRIEGPWEFKINVQ